MTQRTTLLVGSLSYDNEAEAMERSLQKLGGTLHSLPDGEIGEKTAQYPNGKRAAWTMTVINKLKEEPDHWEVEREGAVAADGYPADYDDVPRLRPKHPPGEMLQHLDFGYDRYFEESYPIFKELREKYGVPEMKFQVGVPTGLGITFSMMSPLNAIRYADVFNQQIAKEVNRILAMAGDDVVIQVEVPGEVAAAYQLPSFLMGLSLLSIRGLVNKITPGASIGFHLCWGDLNNKALTNPGTLEKMVKFSNKLVAGFPASHKLAYMHYPLAEAAAPPTLDADYYAPLKDISLPEGADFIAGFVHEKRTEDELRQLRDTIEAVRGGPVGIACSCGLGRRPTEVTSSLIDMMGKLA